jgi:hypothetical protein
MDSIEYIPIENTPQTKMCITPKNPNLSKKQKIRLLKYTFSPPLDKWHQYPNNHGCAG